MRTSEWISVLFLQLFVLLALLRSLPVVKRIRIIALGIAGTALIWIGTRHSIMRDWIPAMIMLLVYWQGGNFYSQPHQKLQEYLERFDKTFAALLPDRSHPFWEMAYFFCYPFVPGAVATMYALQLRSYVDFFWTVVLPPTFLCHLIVSFYQTHPPWKMGNLETRGIFRSLNFIVIRHASIRLNTFPSAHVAASMAVAFALLHVHMIAGLLFMLGALSITASTVIGRYHYVADALLGFLLALCWYFIAVILGSL